MRNLSIPLSGWLVGHPEVTRSWSYFCSDGDGDNDALLEIVVGVEAF
jgi:hypothetical protein